MSKSRRSAAVVVVLLALSLTPSVQATAAPRARVSIQKIEPARWIERWGGPVWKTLTSLWQKAGARIDENGKD